jgi:hypothetical protein
LIVAFAPLSTSTADCTTMPGQISAIDPGNPTGPVTPLTTGVNPASQFIPIPSQ